MFLCFVCSNAVVGLYFNSLFLPGGSENIRRMTTPAISKFAVIADVQFLLYAAKGTIPDYSLGLLRFDHVGRGRLIPLPTLLENIFSHVGLRRLPRECVWILFLCFDVSSCSRD